LGDLIGSVFLWGFSGVVVIGSIIAIIYVFFCMLRQRRLPWDSLKKHKGVVFKSLLNLLGK
jgi:predicted small integral membrane protein